MKNLVFFTQSFPYGQGENFIENEMPFLCKNFDQVILLPLRASGKPTRTVPDNCRVYPPILKNDRNILRKGIFCKAPFFYFIRKFFSEQAYRSFYRLKKYLATSVTCRAILANPNFRQINREYSDATFYFYWGIGIAYVLPFCRNRQGKIVRFHGSDLYLERRPQRYLPFRKEVYENLTKAVFISQQGLEYARKTFGQYHFQGYCSYLGTLDHGLSPVSTSSGEIRVVSCSNVIPLKRVHRILEALLLIQNRRIQWTHIGGGKELGQLRQLTQQLPAHLSVRLTGPLSNAEVLSYYQTNPTDIFVNVSITEGLPVSIMEAISFGIPVVATSVGGTAEIVTPQSGRLLSPEFSNKELAEQILWAYDNKTSFYPRQLWEEKFNAEKNYIRFIQEILNQ